MSTAGVDRNIYSVYRYYFVPPEFQYFSHALIYTPIILRTQYIFTPSSGMYCRHCRVQPGTFGPDSLVPLHNSRQHHLIFICLGRVTGSIMTCMNLTLFHLNFSSISHVFSELISTAPSNVDPVPLPSKQEPLLYICWVHVHM